MPMLFESLEILCLYLINVRGGLKFKRHALASSSDEYDVVVNNSSSLVGHSSRLIHGAK